MIQFNLLPDVKLDYLKAERLRRLVVSLSVIIALVSLVVLIGLLSITILQRKHLKDLERNIKTESAQIQGQSNLNKILTVQNQLNSLTSLHNSKPAVSRMAGYIDQVTPASANINNLSVDLNQHTMAITGTADSLATVNQYVDTLKFTTYSAKGGTSGPAFTSVVLTNFGLSQKEAQYTVTFSYDPTIFDITQSVTLTVPQEVTTRSAVDKPTDLFKLPATTPTGATR